MPPVVAAPIPLPPTSASANFAAHLRDLYSAASGSIHTPQPTHPNPADLSSLSASDCVPVEE